MKPYLDAKRRYRARKTAIGRRLWKPAHISRDGVLRYGYSPWSPICFRYPYKTPYTWMPFLVPLKFPTSEAYYAFVDSWRKNNPTLSNIDYQIFLEKFYLP